MPFRAISHILPALLLLGLLQSSNGIHEDSTSTSSLLQSPSSSPSSTPSTTPSSTPSATPSATPSSTSSANPSSSPTTHSSASPTPPLYEMTAAARNSTEGFLKVTEPDALFYLHKPTILVYGTVLLFCDFGQTPESLDKTASALYHSRFNVITFPLAGPLPTTRIPDGPVRTALLNAIRQAKPMGLRLHDLLKASTASEFRRVALRKNSKPLIPLFKKTLNESSLLPEVLEDALTAINCLSPTDDGLDERSRFHAIQRLFDSTHQRYEGRAILQQTTVSSLPGKLYTVGVGYGAISALTLARSQVVDRVVLLAPRLGRFRTPRIKDHIHVASIISSLETKYLKVPYDDETSLNGAVWVALNIAARRALAPRYAEAARSARILAVMSKDDKTVDAMEIRERIEGSLAGEVIMYELGLGKEILLEDGHAYADSMMNGVVSFLSGKPVDRNVFDPQFSNEGW